MIIFETVPTVLTTRHVWPDCKLSLDVNISHREGGGRKEKTFRKIPNLIPPESLKFEVSAFFYLLYQYVNRTEFYVGTIVVAY
jgi:hypothetical protein